jgi:hypothetical protein
LRTQQEKDRQAAAAEAETKRLEAERVANARGGLIVKTEPEGATITLGGEDAQTSPATFKSIKLGSYPIHITLDGYEPADQTAEIKENQFTDMGTITLMHSKGSLQIASTPPDASYNIKNDAFGIHQSGKCPDTIKDIPVGTYDVTLSRGDWAIKGTATVKRGETASYASEFTYGSVRITSDPSDANVSENGKNLGQTPLVLKNLRPGNHTFTLTHSGYSKGSVSAEVTPNETQSVSATLEKHLSFAGTWTGTIQGTTHYVNGASTPTNTGIETVIVSDDERTLTMSCDGVSGRGKAARSGDTLRVDMGGVLTSAAGEYTTTGSLEITGNGTTVNYNFEATWINGSAKGLTTNCSGVLTRK